MSRQHCSGDDVPPVNRFRLERYDRSGNSRPLCSPLYDEAGRTETLIDGCELLHQFEVPDGYLLITDYDCPFEEKTCFTLLGPSLRILATRSIGGWYSSYLLKSVEWLDERHFLVEFYGGPLLEFTIRPWGIPILRPRLTFRHRPPRVVETA